MLQQCGFFTFANSVFYGKEIMKQMFYLILMKFGWFEQNVLQIHEYLTWVFLFNFSLNKNAFLRKKSGPIFILTYLCIINTYVYIDSGSMWTCQVMIAEKQVGQIWRISHLSDKSVTSAYFKIQFSPQAKYKHLLHVFSV